jgi:Catalase
MDSAWARKKDNSSDDRSLTTRQGHPVTNNQSQRTVGSRGPATLENYHFLEKVSHFDRERIPSASSMRAASSATACSRRRARSATSRPRSLAPLATQLLTEEDQARLKKLGDNGDRIDPKAWGKWTGSVDDRQARRRKS